MNEWIGLMEESTSDIGLMESNMGKARMFLQRVIQEKGNGGKEKERDGFQRVQSNTKINKINKINKICIKG